MIFTSVRFVHFNPSIKIRFVKHVFQAYNWEKISLNVDFQSVIESLLRARHLMRFVVIVTDITIIGRNISFPPY